MIFLNLNYLPYVPLYCTYVHTFLLYFTICTNRKYVSLFRRIGIKMESLSVPFPCSCWTPDRILVNGGEGQDPIDILPFLKDCSDPFLSLRSQKRCSKVDCLELPPSVALSRAACRQRRIARSANRNDSWPLESLLGELAWRMPSILSDGDSWPWVSPHLSCTVLRLTCTMTGTPYRRP